MNRSSTRRDLAAIVAVCSIALSGLATGCNTPIEAGASEMPLEDLRFFRDPDTKLCFVYSASVPKNQRQLSNMPCTQKVLSRIEAQALGSTPPPRPVVAPSTPARPHP